MTSSSSPAHAEAVAAAEAVHSAAAFDALRQQMAAVVHGERGDVQFGVWDALDVPQRREVAAAIHSDFQEG